MKPDYITKKHQYVRIDTFNLLVRGISVQWLHLQPDCEWREDHQCFFILKGSKTHILAALKYGDIFE
jgi:hypothetical protein